MVSYLWITWLLSISVLVFFVHSFSQSVLLCYIFYMFYMLLASYLFLVWLTLQPWRWRRHILLKRRLTFMGLHCIMSENTQFFLFSSVFILFLLFNFVCISLYFCSCRFLIFTLFSPSSCLFCHIFLLPLSEHICITLIMVNLPADCGSVSFRGIGAVNLIRNFIAASSPQPLPLLCFTCFRPRF
jgi:hypothetical protein